MNKSIFLFALIVLFMRGYGQSSGLFDEDELLEITLTGKVGELMKDRGDDPKYHEFRLSYKNKEHASVEMSVKIKARGHFRKLKQNCAYPPLLIDFSEEKSGLFSGQEKLKLVTPCRDEKYVVREYLVYKMYNLVTPKSFRARLVKFSMISNESKGKNIESLFGILLEEEDQMAKRNHSITIDGKLVRPQQTQPDDFLNMAVFEYLIGNTDWSVQYLQNVKLIASDSLSIPSTVPYDFDHAGIVGAPYAQPAAELQMTSIRERRYRGYCVNDMKQFDIVLSRFSQLKDDFYKVYAGNTLIDEGYAKSTYRYLDEFYNTVSDSTKLRAAFQYPCRSDGTGNVVIKGLKKD